MTGYTQENIVSLSFSGLEVSMNFIQPGFGNFGMCGPCGPSPMMGMHMMLMMQMLQMMQGLMGQQGCCHHHHCAPPTSYPDMMGANFGLPCGGPPSFCPPGAPWGGRYASPPYTPPMSFGNVPYNAAGGNRLASMAASMNGQHFKPGQTKRCADFVSTMLRQSGTAPPGFKHTASCTNLQQYGSKVGMKDLKPGDLVFFGNTYRKGKYTHVGIYVGDGKFAHRPTANKPVRIDSLSSGRYAQKFTGGRRMPSAC